MSLSPVDCFLSFSIRVRGAPTPLLLLIDTRAFFNRSLL